MPRGVLVIGTIFGLVGVGLLIGAFFAVSSTLSFRSGSTPAEGVVVEMVESRGSKGDRMFKPVVKWTDAKGGTHQLTGSVASFTAEDALRKHLEGLEPYGFFSTCGLMAVVFRLRALYALLRESMLELGTLQEFRWQMPRDSVGHLIVLPGAVEAFRMVAEGLEKTTGTERLDGIWGYERRRVPDRRDGIAGLS